MSMPSRRFSLNNIKPSFIPAIAWFIISFVLLTLPGSSFPKENWFSMIWLDKWVHIGMFAILVTLWCWAMLKLYSASYRLKTIFLWIGLMGIAYGTGMEFVQKFFIKGRSFELGDIASDSIGSVLGVFFSIKRYIKNRPL
jgi:hypothetical protein